jgi:hypothetical protein
VRLVWVAVTMPSELLTWHGQHDFSITEKRAAILNFKFGGTSAAAQPTKVADAVIRLPGPEHYKARRQHEGLD